MIRTLSLTLEGLTESAAKATVAQPKFLDSLARVAAGNRIAFDYHLAVQGGVCSMANVTWCIWIHTSGLSPNKPVGLEKQSPSMGSLTYLILTGLGLGDQASEVHSRHC